MVAHTQMLMTCCLPTFCHDFTLYRNACHPNMLNTSKCALHVATSGLHIVLYSAALSCPVMHVTRGVTPPFDALLHLPQTAEDSQGGFFPRRQLRPRAKETSSRPSRFWQHTLGEQMR